MVKLGRVQAVLTGLLFALAIDVPLYAQNRPLQTEDPAVIAPGNVSIEFGFDFLQGAHFPQSGLQGDLTSLGVMAVDIGLGKVVEFQIQGTIRDFLSVSSKTTAPIVPQLNSSGTATNDFGDIVFATKILILPEGTHRPSIGFRPAVQLPNATAESGLGMNSTQFFGTLTLGKHLDKFQTLGNLGLGILSNPIQASVQNDVLIYGLAGLYPLNPKIKVVGEVFGRWSTHSPPPLGTESRGQFRFGLQILGAGFRWDLGGIAGLTNTSPSTGITFGLTKEFHAFRL